MCPVPSCPPCPAGKSQTGICLPKQAAWTTALLKFNQQMICSHPSSHGNGHITFPWHPTPNLAHSAVTMSLTQAVEVPRQTVLGLPFSMTQPELMALWYPIPAPIISQTCKGKEAQQLKSNKTESSEAAKHPVLFIETFNAKWSIQWNLATGIPKHRFKMKSNKQ